MGIAPVSAEGGESGQDASIKGIGRLTRMVVTETYHLFKKPGFARNSFNLGY
jgi:hypothetical protein